MTNNVFSNLQADVVDEITSYEDISMKQFDENQTKAWIAVATMVGVVALCIDEIKTNPSGKTAEQINNIKDSECTLNKCAGYALDALTSFEDDEPMEAHELAFISKIVTAAWVKSGNLDFYKKILKKSWETINLRAVKI